MTKPSSSGTKRKASSSEDSRLRVRLKGSSSEDSIFSLQPCTTTASSSEDSTLRLRSFTSKASSSEDSSLRLPSLTSKASSSEDLSLRLRSLTSKASTSDDSDLRLQSLTTKASSSEDFSLRLRSRTSKASSSEDSSLRLQSQTSKASTSEDLDLRLHSWTSKASEDSSLLPCPTLDRISNLPDDVLGQVLSLLPTKDAASMSVLSIRMRRVFYLITNIDIDASPFANCSVCPRAIERLPCFINFVNTVIRVLSLSGHDLTKFRLRLGRNQLKSQSDSYHHQCHRGCFPDLEPALVNSWISFPLTRNIREVDVLLHLRKSGQLPAALFTCEKLEVLKLDANLDVDQTFSTPFFFLPNLKVLHLCSLFISVDDFVTKLVSSCPSLEVLSLKCEWKHADVINISSCSLHTLVLNVQKYCDAGNSNVFHLDTPNLQYLCYDDNLALQTNVAYMNALVEADININYYLQNDPEEGSFRSMLSLTRAVSNVQHLSLTGACMEALDLDGIKDHLPVFHNLRHLELGYSGFTRWNKVLLAFLNSSPYLETLAFPEGLSDDDCGGDCDEDRVEVAELERQFCRTTQATAWRCWSGLRRIVIRRYQGQERELELIKLFLQNASTLEKLLCQTTVREKDLMAHERTLKKLPRSSTNCSVEVQ